MEGVDIFRIAYIHIHTYVSATNCPLTLFVLPLRDAGSTPTVQWGPAELCSLSGFALTYEFCNLRGLVCLKTE